MAIPKYKYSLFSDIFTMEKEIPYLVKFLQKLSKIETDKNFLKRAEVDVIYFRPLIIILLNFKDFLKL